MCDIIICEILRANRNFFSSELVLARDVFSSKALNIRGTVLI